MGESELADAGRADAERAAGGGILRDDIPEGAHGERLGQTLGAGEGPVDTGFRLEGGDAEAEKAYESVSTIHDQSYTPPSRMGKPDVPGYAIIAELGRGGLGVVYLARQIRLNRLCALKMILAGEHATPESVARFYAEAAAVARMRHPNIVQIYSIGEHEGRPYLELEYVSGGSLAERLKGSPRPPAYAAWLVEILARAIHEAHHRGIVHRDLKPANVLIAYDETPMIGDFGLAKALDVEASLTQAQAIVGTPAYMAPEQAEGESLELGPAADIYSLGVILYELLTGRPPFQAATVLEILGKVKSAEPVAPSRLRPGVPRDLETICLVCLRKEPRRRYASAEVLAEDLRRFTNREPILGRRTGPVERAWRWAGRNRAVAGMAAAVAALLVVATLIATVAAVKYGSMARVERDLRSKAELAERQAEDKARAEARANELLEVALYSGRIALAEREWTASNVGLVEELLAECPFGLRGWEWRYLDRLRQREPQPPLAVSPEDVKAVAFGPGGRVLAWTGPGGSTVLIDPANGRGRVDLKGDQVRVTGLAFSPDGRTLASAGEDGTVRLWDVASRREVGRLAGHAGHVYAVAFSPDGARVVSAGQDRVVRVWDVASGREVTALRGHSEPVIGLAFGRDGRVVSSGYDGVRVWDSPSGREVHFLHGHKGAATGVALSPDGRWIASACTDEVVRVWDATTGRLRHVLRGHSGEVWGVAFHPDGTRLASASYDATVKVWDVANGTEALTLRGPTGHLYAVAFSPDGSLLVSGGGDGVLRKWDARPVTGKARPGLLWTLRGHSRRVTGVAFRDGRRLASSSVDGAVRLWHVTTERLVLSPARAADTLGIAYAADGRLAAACADGTVRVWNPDICDSPCPLRGHEGAVNGVAFDAKGDRLASAGEDRRVIVWDAATGLIVHTLKGHRGPVRAVAFSPDGTRLVSAGGFGDESVRVWDMKSGLEIRALTARAGPVYAVAISPDGAIVASAGSDGVVRLWDAATGAPRLNLTGHKGHVTGLAFSPDGRTLASAGADKTLRLWAVASGSLAHIYDSHAGPVRVVAYSPDGIYLATGGDGPVEVWDAKAAR